MLVKLFFNATLNIDMCLQIYYIDYVLNSSKVARVTSNYLSYQSENFVSFCFLIKP